MPPGSTRDPVVGSIQKALWRSGAQHLLTDDSVLIRAEHTRTVDVISDVLTRHPSPRFVTAIPTVLVVSSNEIPFSAVQDAVVRAGVPRRWAWLLARFLEAYTRVDGGSLQWRRASQRAVVLAEGFLLLMTAPGPDVAPDILDQDVRSQATLRAAWARAADADRKWLVLSRLTSDDFVEPLEALRDTL